MRGKFNFSLSQKSVEKKIRGIKIKVNLFIIKKISNHTLICNLQIMQNMK